MTPPIATLLSASVVMVVSLVGVSLIVLWLVGPVLEFETMAEGMKASFRGTWRWSVVLFGVLSLVSWPVVAASEPWEFAGITLLAAIVASGAFIHQLCAYQSRLELHATPFAPRPGEAIQVRWTVTAPVRPRATRVVLVGRERLVRGLGQNGEIKTQVLVEVPVAADGVAVVPAAAVPCFHAFLSEHLHAIEWVLVVTVELPMWPDLKVEVPVGVRGAVGDAVPRDPAPPVVAPQAVALGVWLDGDHRNFEPGEPIAGVITWERPTAPRSAKVCLVAESLACDVPESVRAGGQMLAVEALPRVFAQEHHDPYRSATGETSALAASECRRFEFAGPHTPYSYHGALFRVHWRLEATVDDEVQSIDLVIGPGGEVARHRPPPGGRGALTA